jgi:hypothetical protein
MTKDKKKKSPHRRRKAQKTDCVVFSDNWGVVREYGRNGTSVATPNELDPTFFKDLLKRLTQQKEAGYEQ